MTRPLTSTLARSVALCAALAIVPSLVRAQGTLSAQGFGYPTGQLSTRAQGTAGALGDFDPRTPLNPAALAIGATGPELYGQYDPEIRSVKGPSGSSRTTTSRFPNLGLIWPMGKHLVGGLSASNFLDRSWATVSTRLQQIGTETDTVTSNETLKSEGGIADLRVALAYAFNKYIRVGVGGHYFSGSNRLELLQQFPVGRGFSDISQTTTLNYGGTAVSAGAGVDLPYGISLAGSGRKGGDIHMSSNDTTLSEGHIPDRYSASLGYTGLPGTTLAVRYGVDRWKSMESLSTTGATAVQTNDFSVGLESSGPKTGDQAVQFRLGGRWRTLPFQVASMTVKERSFGGGVGIPVSHNNATLDVSLLRSARTGVTGVTETAYNLSFGLRIRPRP